MPTSEDQITDAVTQAADPALSAEPFVSDESVPAATYTADDIAKAREQEKKKLYPQIDKMREELATLRKLEEERAAQEEARREQRRQRDAEAAEKKKQKEEEEMSFKQLLKTKEQEWQSQLEQERLEREKAFALLEREREFQEIQNYRAQRVEQERDNIVPELIDLIQGASVDEIEQSINTLKEKSARILDSVAQVAQQSRKEMRTATPTLPASSLDNDTDSRMYSADDLANMSMADYAKNRSKLLGSANNRGQGLFGN